MRVTFTEGRRAENSPIMDPSLVLCDTAQSLGCLATRFMTSRPCAEATHAPCRCLSINSRAARPT